MPATRQQRLNAIEEEQLALNSEGPSLLNRAEPNNSAPAEAGANVDRDNQIAALEREMYRISAQLNQLAVNPAGSNSRATMSAEEVVKSLQTPSTLRDLIPFDGNPIKLNQFLKAVDGVMPVLEQAKDSPMFELWMQSIRSKIIGDADTILELYGTGLDWDEIKSNLISHYSDKRDEISLTRDLFKLSQTGTVLNLYENVSHIISLLVNQLVINEKDANVKRAKQKFYQEMGLKVFVAGLKDPLGPIIRAQAPRTLKEALRLCSEETNYNYVQSSFKTMTPHSGAIPKQIVAQQQRPQYRPPMHQTPRAQSNDRVQHQRPPYNPNQNYFKPSYPPPNGTQPYNNSYMRDTTSNHAPVSQTPTSNFNKSNYFKKPQSGRTHGTNAYKPNFNIEKEVYGCDNEPNDTDHYDGAYYYEECDPRSNNDGNVHNPQPPQTISPFQPDTSEDELNFHIAEQAAMKR